MTVLCLIIAAKLIGDGIRPGGIVSRRIQLKAQCRLRQGLPMWLVKSSLITTIRRSTAGSTARRAPYDESRGARPGVVQRPTARDGLAAVLALLKRPRRSGHCSSSSPQGLPRAGDRPARGPDLPRCQRGNRGLDVHRRARRHLRCGGARVRGRAATGAGFNRRVGPVRARRAGHRLAVWPAPAQPLPGVRSRRGWHASTRSHLPGRAQRDRLRRPASWTPACRSRSTTRSGSWFPSRRSCW